MQPASVAYFLIAVMRMCPYRCLGPAASEISADWPVVHGCCCDEPVQVNGEVSYDPTRVARLAARADGTMTSSRKELTRCSTTS